MTACAALVAFPALQFVANVLHLAIEPVEFSDVTDIESFVLGNTDGHEALHHLLHTVSMALGSTHQKLVLHLRTRSENFSGCQHRVQSSATSERLKRPKFRAK